MREVVVGEHRQSMLILLANPVKNWPTIERTYNAGVDVRPRSRACSTRRTTAASRPMPAQNVK